MSDRSTVTQQGDRSLPVAPPLSTLQALEEQTTPELMRQLQRYAQARVRQVRNAGRAVSEADASELVHDVHTDTRLGVLTWDPQHKLLDHMRREIKKRTWLEIRRARRITLVSLQEPANDEMMSPQMAHVLACAPQNSCSPLALHELTSTVCQQVQRLIRHDLEAIAIVTCWADGSLERSEVMRRTGMTEAVYEGARTRLRYALRNLPSDLCETARDLLRCAA